MQRRRRIEVAGALPSGLLDEVTSRFGQNQVRRVAGHTVLDVADLDESATRALLELLWESGVAVLALSSDDAADDDRRNLP